MARTVLPFVGAAVGFWIGGPSGAQIGFALGGVVGNVVDPVKNIGPRIGETGPQTSAEGAARAIVFGTAHLTGNIIVAGELIKGDFEEEGGGKGGPVNVTERCFRTYAIRICEGPIEGVLRIWENDKLVVDNRPMDGLLGFYRGLENEKWMFGVGIYYGDETQMPDSFLTVNTYADNPAYRGTAYIVFVFRDLTDFRGAIPQYRFEVARTIAPSIPGLVTNGPENNNFTYLDLDEIDIPFMMMNQTGGFARAFEVGFPGTYDVNTYDLGFLGSIPTSVTTIANAGTSVAADDRLWPIAINEDGYALSYHGSSGYCMVALEGAVIGYLYPEVGAIPGWWYNEAGYFPEYGGLVFFDEGGMYLGVRTVGEGAGTPWDRIMLFSLGGGNRYPSAVITNVAGANLRFWMNFSRSRIMYTLNQSGVFKSYDSELSFLADLTLPSAVASYIAATPQTFNGFGLDEEKDMAVYVYGGTGAYIYRNSTNELLGSYTLTGAGSGVTTRVIFSDIGIYIQRTSRAYFISIPATMEGVPMLLGDIVAEIHERCGVGSDSYDVSELTDEVAGLVLAGEYTGADAINTLRGPYFFDKSEYDQKLWYPKRGAAVVETLTIDDLIDEPDTQMREQAIEYPRKFNLFYQHANSGYAVVKATSSRSSPDVRVVGEVTAQVPVTFVGAEDEAAQTADKMHKVSWAEAEGEVKFSVPWSFLKLVPSNPIGLSLRGRVNRLRLTQLDLHDGVIDVTARHDRQSAYTSNVTGIPIPDPTPPPSTIVGSTTLLVLDIPSLQDTEDDLNIYYAVTGTQPAWYGAVVQRSLDSGSSWSTVATIESAARIGELTAAVADASASGTDTTNTVHVRLYRDGQTLESVTEAQFLSERNAFALENADGSWEIMQARDWVQDSAGDWIGSRLHRGRLDTTTNAHAIGRRFVMLEDVTHVPVQSSMIGQTVLHRAPSLSQSPELAGEQSLVYTGASQIEWPPASLVLARSAANIVTGTWAPRFRFGTDDAPVNSINMTGYRVTIVGTSSVVLPDQTAANFSYDASALGASVTVSVQTLNRITGAGPATSGTI